MLEPQESTAITIRDRDDGNVAMYLDFYGLRFKDPNATGKDGPDAED